MLDAIKADPVIHENFHKLPPLYIRMRIDNIQGYLRGDETYPRIIGTSSRTERVMEGSIAPGAPRGYVERPSHVTVLAVDRNGESVEVTGEGFLAATFCHEIDHLDGILFSDKIVEMK